jgi:hypothetical protein
MSVSPSMIRLTWLAPSQVISTPGYSMAHLLAEQGQVKGYVALDVLSLKADDTGKVVNLFYQTFNSDCK